MYGMIVADFRWDYGFGQRLVEDFVKTSKQVKEAVQFSCWACSWWCAGCAATAAIDRCLWRGILSSSCRPPSVLATQWLQPLLANVNGIAIFWGYLSDDDLQHGKRHTAALPSSSNPAGWSWTPLTTTGWNKILQLRLQGSVPSILVLGHLVLIQLYLRENLCQPVKIKHGDTA